MSLEYTGTFDIGNVLGLTLGVALGDGLDCVLWKLTLCVPIALGDVVGSTLVALRHTSTVAFGDINKYQ